MGDDAVLERTRRHRGRRGRSARGGGHGGYAGVKRLVGGQEVPIEKRIEVAAVAGKKREAARQHPEFIQVDREEEKPVDEAMRPRCEPGVHDLALVETGVHYRA